jgi:hypothetical protein
VPIVDVELVGDDPVTGATTQRLADALGEALSSPSWSDPDHVHVLFEPDAAGRLSFGGRLVE